MLWIFVVYFTFTLYQGTRAEIIHTTKFFILPIEPELFNWTLHMGEEFKYHASLLKSPDLPDWIQYLYSRRHKTGFLYGVAPPNQEAIEIEIVAMNKRTYETRRRVVHLNVQEKKHPATKHIHLKIDNLNVEELFDSYKLTKLLDIFRFKLWKESFGDLYVTFMSSAVTQGARLPLKPSESEGVVVRLGSTTNFSGNLIELQEEVKPLWKLHSCPRDFKRTTVERWFREEGFALDWCSFKLIESPPTAQKGLKADDLEVEVHSDELWKPLSRTLIPERSYSGEFAITILIPMLIMVVLVVMLSIILCFQHECGSKQKETEPIEKITQYAAVQRATSTLRSLSRPRDTTPDTAQSVPLPDDDVTRPNPPPYTGTLRIPNQEF